MAARVVAFEIVSLALKINSASGEPAPKVRTESETAGVAGVASVIHFSKSAFFPFLLSSTATISSCIFPNTCIFLAVISISARVPKPVPLVLLRHSQDSLIIFKFSFSSSVNMSNVTSESGKLPPDKTFCAIISIEDPAPAFTKSLETIFSESTASAMAISVWLLINLSLKSLDIPGKLAGKLENISS